MTFAIGVAEMLHGLLNHLATLASLEYQERYVIGGTAQEYVVIDDLFEDYYSSVFWANHHANRHNFSVKHLDLLNEFMDFLSSSHELAFAAASHDEVGPLMRETEIWNDIRERAKSVLAAMGVSIEGVAVDALDEHDFVYRPKD